MESASESRSLLCRLSTMALTLRFRSSFFLALVRLPLSASFARCIPAHQDVPIDATLQGRPVSHGASSRFRTGRLESAQMIIPSLLAEHVKEDGQPSSDEEEDAEGRKDGLTRDERERLRRSLEAIGRGEMPEPMEIGAPAGGVKEVVEKGKQVVREKAPPQVIATPISVPSNAPMRKEERLPTAPAPLAPGDKPKKMSRCGAPFTARSTELTRSLFVRRFKARQMGLDPDE